MEKKEVDIPSSNVPGFLAKLWLLVADATNDELIGWSPFGNSFIVQNQTRFAKEILPKFFKHNNMASFIRQLNMYGFRKKANLEHGCLKLESDEIEFQHPNFIQGRPDLLENIKRKVSARDENKLKYEDMHQILTDVQDMKGKQENISGTLDAIQRENQILWREVVYLRQRHEKQQKIVNRLIQFLLTMVKPVGLKRKQQLMIESASDASKPKFSRLANPGDNIQVIEPVSFDSDIATLAEVNTLPSGAVVSDVTDIVPCATGQPLSSPTLEPSAAAGQPLSSPTLEPSAVAAVSDQTPATLDPSLFELDIPPQSAGTVQGLASPVVALSPPATLEPTSSDLSPLSGGDAGMFGITEWPLLESGSQANADMALLFDTDEEGGQGMGALGNGPGSSQGPMSGTTSSFGSRAIMKRMLSHEEQRGEIGEHVNSVQENLDLIQHMLTSIGSTGPYNLDMESLMEIFNSDRSGNANETDLFPNMAVSHSQNTEDGDQENVKGNEVVQYVSSSPSFTVEDEDSLLRSLDDDAVALAGPYDRPKV